VYFVSEAAQVELKSERVSAPAPRESQQRRHRVVAAQVEIESKASKQFTIF
jgi:hypothetical protein